MVGGNRERLVCLCLRPLCPDYATRKTRRLEAIRRPVRVKRKERLSGITVDFSFCSALSIFFRHPQFCFADIAGAKFGRWLIIRGVRERIYVDPRALA